MSWVAIARSQCGVISNGQLRRAGLSLDQIRSLREGGALEPVWRSTYLVRGAPLTYDARLWSAVLSSGGVLGFGTAAHLWGVIDTAPDRIEVIVPRQLHQWRRRELRIHRIDLPRGSFDRRHGLPITTRRETILDHIGRMPQSRALALADRAVQREWVEPGDFARRLRTQPGRTGNTRLRLLGALMSDGAAAKSERVLHGLLRRAGIDGWHPNCDIWVGGELIAVVDVAFREARLAVEVDGFAFHTGQDRFQRDRTRQNSLVGLGWTVLRFTWADLVDRPGYVIATIRRSLANSGSFVG